MRPVVIIIQPPSIDNISRLGEIQEQLTIEALISKLAVEALDVSIFPGTARLDEQCSDILLLQPPLDGLRRELRTVIAANVIRATTQLEQVPKNFNHIRAGKVSGHLDRQALPCELIHNIQHPNPAAAFSPLRHEVIAPDVVLAQWLMTMTGVAAIAQSPAFTGLSAYLKPAGLPQPVNTFDVDTPAFLAKQNRDPAITESGPL